MSRLHTNFLRRKDCARIILGRKLCCPVCHLRLHSAQAYYWCGSCRKKWRPKALTWLRHSRISDHHLSLLLIAWQKKLPPGSIKYLVGLSYPTIRRYFRLFRDHLPLDTEKLEGVLEADEAYLGRQRFDNQVMLLGVTSRATGHLRIEPAENRDQGTIEAFLYRHLGSDAYVHTDAHGGYHDLEAYGWGHQIHDHGQRRFSGTNHIESSWSRLKRHYRRQYGRFHRPYLPQFLKEWQARHNFPELFTSPESYLESTLRSVIFH